MAKIQFSKFVGDRGILEAEARGVLQGVYLVFDDGRKIPVVFYDTARLWQDMHEDIQRRSCFVVGAIVVVESVTLENMEKAAQNIQAATDIEWYDLDRVWGPDRKF
jgi:hypothetical protein